MTDTTLTTPPTQSVLTAAPKIAGAATDPMAKAFGSAPSAPGPANQPSVPKGFMPEVKTPGADAQAFGTGLAAQYQNLFDTAKQAARARMRFGLGSSSSARPAQGGIFAALGLGQGQNDKSIVQPQGTPQRADLAGSGALQNGAAQDNAPKDLGIPAQTAQPQVPASPPPDPNLGAFAQQNGVTMGRGLFGADTASFDYNGARLSLPSGIDLKDDDAVRAAMDESRAMADAMNAAYNAEEEW